MLQTENQNEQAIETIDRLSYGNTKFEARILEKKGKCYPFRIIDQNQVCITKREKTKSGMPHVIWTNAPNVVGFYKENFEALWKTAKTFPKYTNKNPC